MASIAEQLKALEESRDALQEKQAKAEEKLADVTRTLGDSRTDLERLTAARRVVDAEVDATEKQQREVTAAAAAITEVRTRIGDEFAKLTADREKLISRVAPELAEARRAALETEIGKVDDAITAAKDAEQKASGDLSHAEADVAAAREESAAADRAHADALQRFQAIPKNIEALRGKVIAIRDAATKAVDAGRMAEAFTRAWDLNTAIETLAEAWQASGAADPVKELPALWEARLSSARKLAELTADVGTRQAAAAEARRVKDGLVANRDQDIAKMLNAPPASEPAGEGEAVDPSAPPETEATPVRIEDGDEPPGPNE